jgi:hypothetical protein
LLLRMVMNKPSRFSFCIGSLLAVALATTGCPTAPPPTEGPPDAGSSPTAACYDAVDLERNVECTDTSRQCLYAALRPFCARGRTGYAEAAFQCLSDQGIGCPSPSDPSGAQSCIDSVMNEYATTADRTTGAALCDCESSPEAGCELGLPETLMSTLMFMNPDDVAAIGDCVTTRGCDQVQACIDASPLAPADQCAD